MTYLLDTNVISAIRKERGNARVQAWFAHTAADELYLSVLTVGEIRNGIERLRRRDPTQTSVFEAWLVALQRDFAERLLPITAEVADAWGRLGVPNPVPTVDGLLAATARVGGLTLVTRNTADLMRTGVQLLKSIRRRQLIRHQSRSGTLPQVVCRLGRNSRRGEISQ